jgi:hypothetical protein
VVYCWIAVTVTVTVTVTVYRKSTGGMTTTR